MIRPEEPLLYRYGNVVRHVWPAVKCMVCNRELRYVHGKEVRNQGQPHIIAGYTCAHHTTEQLQKVIQQAHHRPQESGQRREEEAMAPRGRRAPSRREPTRRGS